MNEKFKQHERHEKAAKPPAFCINTRHQAKATLSGKEYEGKKINGFHHKPHENNFDDPAPSTVKSDDPSSTENTGFPQSNDAYELHFRM